MNLGGSAGPLDGVCDVRRIWTDCRKRLEKLDDVQYGEEPKFCEIINYTQMQNGQQLVSRSSAAKIRSSPCEFNYLSCEKHKYSQNVYK